MRFTLLFAVLLTGTTCLSQTPINTEEVISIGGIRQYITISGTDHSLPILLYLHGGPGGSVMHYAEKFTDELQKHFVVIHWDQRETGRTLQLNPSPIALSLSLIQSDTRELIEFLLKRFDRPKLYLAGHSWGTSLAFHIAENYPSFLYACVVIGPMINQVESERVALSLMKEKASRTGNRKEAHELALVHIPFEDGAQLYYHRKWLLDFSGSRKTLSKSYVENWSATWLKVFNEASTINLMETAPNLKCPVYFFAGRKDIQTNSAITEQYYNLLVAPKKALFWFENSAHGVPTTEPRRLQTLIIEKVLPETFVLQTPAAVIGQSPEP